MLHICIFLNKRLLVATTEITEYQYDHAGRQTSIKHSIDTTPTEIATYSYDAIGRLATKKILPNGTFYTGGAQDYINRSTSTTGGTDLARLAVCILPNTTITGTFTACIDPNAASGQPINGLQTLDYKYHIRGGLLGINLDNAKNPIPNATEGDLFSYKIDHETAGQWDGNIGKQSWKNPTEAQRSYAYSYDPAKRLKTATYTGVGAENFSLPNINYDKNGNITNLQRNGKIGTSSSFGVIDNLSYGYVGNRLNNVTDAISGNNTVDFVQRGGANYTYWNDGSLKSDANEQISNILYDSYLKQPKEIQLTDGRWIKHFYNGAGILLKTLYSNGEYWDFVGNMIYKNGLPYQMNFPEGRAIYQNGNWQYEFDYKDHLGNTRVSFKANGNNLEKTAETAFDPWGVVLNGAGVVNGIQNRFELQGKESEKTFGLNWVNFRARKANPTIGGRWDRVDEMSTMYPSFSTYNYNLNNPLKFIDPDGSAPVDITLLGSNNSSVTVKTDLVDLKINASSLRIDFGGNHTLQGSNVLQAALDIGGVFDPTPALDIFGASMSAKSGDYWGAGASILGAVVPYAGDIAKAPKIAKGLDVLSDAIHGNSKLSQKVQHGYEIFNNKTGEVLEYGISGQKRNASQITNGSSPRINQKLKTKYGNDPDVSGKVTDANIGNRQQGLDWEQQKVSDFAKKNGGIGPTQQKLPTPKF